MSECMGSMGFVAGGKQAYLPSNCVQICFTTDEWSLHMSKEGAAPRHQVGALFSKQRTKRVYGGSGAMSQTKRLYASFDSVAEQMNLYMMM